MRSSTIIWIVVILIIIVGGWWWLSQGSAGDDMQPSTNAGINGSPNQGNLGATSTGSVQQPGEEQKENQTGTQEMGDGTGVSQNLILGLSTDTKLGQYLSAYNGMTVYTYAKDTAGTSNCTGQCATNWPPYTVKAASDIHVPSTFTASNIGTITRADGSLQVTYKGKPLYFYKGDAKVGDVNGQGVGGVWYVVKQ